MSQSDQLEISQEFIKNFWPNQDTSPEAIAAYHKEDKDFGWLEEVQTILCANQAKDLSDTELLRCTENCVCGLLLFHLGIIFRETGMLTTPEREEKDETKEREKEEMKTQNEDNVIIWVSTGLGIWYPTINGKDAWRDFSKKHGCTLSDANHPLCDSVEEATEWSIKRGYTAEFQAYSAASTLGRLGGLAKSEAKAISSRENGKKGGRPRKAREEEAIEAIEESNLDLFK